MNAGLDFITVVAVLVVIARSTPAATPTCEEVAAQIATAESTTSLSAWREAVRTLRTHCLQADHRGNHQLDLAHALTALGRAEVLAGDAAVALRAFDDGIAAAQAAIARRPDSARAHATLGDAYGQRAARSSMVDRVRFGRRAVAAHARAVELDPANAAAHVGLGIAKLETPALLGGSADAALRFFRRARELEPGLARAWIWEGIALRRAGQSAEARDALRRALTLEPHNGQAQAELSSLDSDASK